jgi:UPF0755 protein
MNDMSDAAAGTRSGDRRVSPISPKRARELLQPEKVPPPPPRSRAVRHPVVVFLNFFLTIAVLAVVGVVGVALFAKVQFDGTGPLQEQRSVQIAPGAGVSAIADLLQERGVISNRWIFRAGVGFYGAGSSLKAGEYLIPAQASMHEIMEMMVEGNAVTYRVSIPEGLTSQQVVQRLMDEELLTGEITSLPPEGSLLPDTYVFSRGDNRQNIINQMRRQRDRVLTEVWNRRVAGLPIATPEELVTLASIVEKETGVPAERRTVAGVYTNRLAVGMKLQADPTIIYPITKGKPLGRRILRSEIQAVNDYNTYAMAGLPKGPIANPGKASIAAVLDPEANDYLFFVAKRDGGHIFARTLAEHNANVQKWYQLRRERGEME